MPTSLIMFHYEKAWQDVRSRIARAARACGREPEAVRLVAVSKTFPAEAVRARLAGDSYRGIAGTYRSDGKGNMAHEAEIVCFDGKSRVPSVVARY